MDSLRDRLYLSPLLFLYVFRIEVWAKFCCGVLVFLWGRVEAWYQWRLSVIIEKREREEKLSGGSREPERGGSDSAPKSIHFEYTWSTC